MNKHLAEIIFCFCVGGVLAILVWSAQDKPMHVGAFFLALAALSGASVIAFNWLFEKLETPRKE